MLWGNYCNVLNFKLFYYLKGKLYKQIWLFVYNVLSLQKCIPYSFRIAAIDNNSKANLGSHLIVMVTVLLIFIVVLCLFVCLSSSCVLCSQCCQYLWVVSFFNLPWVFCLTFAVIYILHSHTYYDIIHKEGSFNVIFWNICQFLKFDIILHS